ncbi:hypothetical protein IL306_004055 [Fusarium sp. DS 682]|nr:hypothetical protein IL306_004055 [Fusarium sp. DS 682]
MFQRNAALIMDQKKAPEEGQDALEYTDSSEPDHTNQALEESHELKYIDAIVLQQDDCHDPQNHGQSKPFSEEHRALILKQNDEYFADDRQGHPVDFRGRGRKCLGPGLGTRYFVTEKCPFDTEIDFDTARLKLRRIHKGIQKLSLDGEYVACRPTKQARLSLNRIRAYKDKLSEYDLKTLRKKYDVATQKSWSYENPYRREGWNEEKDYERVLKRKEDIEFHGGRDPDLVLLDLEWTFTDRRVTEIAIIGRVSGKTLLNALVDDTSGQSSRFPGVQSQNHKLQRLTVDEIASAIIEAGITPKTLVLVWHQSCTDLQLLRQLLEGGGHYNILPGDENCIPLIQLFRLNLRRLGPEKLYPLKLEVLFPVVFPQSDLVGRNHQALVDCHQTRLLCEDFDELRKPYDQRSPEWKRDRLFKQSNRSIIESSPKKRKASALDEERELIKCSKRLSIVK